MSVRTRLGLIVLWVSSLVAVSMWASAQSRQVIPESPVVLSGSDLGFRVEGPQGSARVGRLVVRVDGQWGEGAASRRDYASDRQVASRAVYGLS